MIRVIGQVDSTITTINNASIVVCDEKLIVNSVGVQMLFTNINNVIAMMNNDWRYDK